jgi:hypothetical protein
MRLKKIRLELARDHDFPDGSREHGYEFVAPVRDDDMLDPDGWKLHRAECRARRFWGPDDEETGHLIRKPGGHWAFHYDTHSAQNPDESGYRFGNHPFRTGQYVSIREHDDRLRTFRVVRIDDLPAG